MSLRTGFRLGLPAAILVLLATFAKAAPQEELAFFENRVRPLLAEKCFKCHGKQKSQGGLRLDSLTRILEGGENGPALVPGKPRESLLIDAVHYESLEMPPTGRLTASEIAILERWVGLGAPWPGESVESAADLRSKPDKITDEDRAHWAFQPLRRVDPPELAGDTWPANEIDRFILRRMQMSGLEPTMEAEPRKLVRRLYLDLHGLPPTPAEIADYLADDSPTAYEELVGRLLESPRYGERWARHWLDLVRYAESDGYKADDYRPSAWRYRDYVIAAFNEDKPYDQFVIEQIAGDEIAPHDLDALTATSYLRHWIYEYNQRDARTQWSGILDDVTNVTGEVFLGMGMGCARCHDHKFDPILREDYYRLRAFFAGILPRDDLYYASTAEQAEYQAKLLDWEQQTNDLRMELRALEEPLRAEVAQDQISRFPPDIRPLFHKTPEDRLPLERQFNYIVNGYFLRSHAQIKFEKQLGETERKRWKELQEELKRYEDSRPPAPPLAFAVTDVGPNPPTTTIPGDRSGREILPGFLTILEPGEAKIHPAPATSESSGRRYTLAKWLTNPENPLTTRVAVNRVWQYHFGRGLVETSNNFGHLGSRPTHPDLLDWLATWFVDSGWSFRKLHRLIVTSATYRQSAVHPAPKSALRLDAKNELLWHMPVRRLDAEQLRDAALAVSGELDLTEGGPSVDGDQPRRTIYTKILRNQRDPLLEAFDGPDGFSSTPQRSVTTTPTQALMLINGDWMVQRARALADRIVESSDQDLDRINFAFQWVLGRPAAEDDEQETLQFLEQQRRAGGGSHTPQLDAWIDFCHVLLNSNEFLYID